MISKIYASILLETWVGIIESFGKIRSCKQRRYMEKVYKNISCLYPTGTFKKMLKILIFSINLKFNKYYQNNNVIPK